LPGANALTYTDGYRTILRSSAIRQFFSKNFARENDGCSVTIRRLNELRNNANHVDNWGGFGKRLYCPKMPRIANDGKYGGFSVINTLKVITFKPLNSLKVLCPTRMQFAQQPCCSALSRRRSAVINKVIHCFCEHRFNDGVVRRNTESRL
jgi:hypothetical protein